MPFADKASKLKALQKALQGHKIYSNVKSEVNMKIFMETHCFAVWDFMLLLKELQRRLTCMDKIWRPCVSANTARFINQIVVGEETDIHPNGKDHISHFELYIQSMKEVGANTEPILNFVNNVAAGSPIEYELKNKSVPQGVAEFVLNTYSSLSKPTPWVASQFFYGRQDPIPQMFQQFVDNMGDNKKFDALKYYLNRHILVDGQQHGPMSQKLMIELAQREDKKYQVITDSAANAVEYRIKLWDSICNRLELQTPTATLFDRLGGQGAINSVVDKFYVYMLADPVTKHFFDNVDMKKQVERQKQFLILVTGGPNNYQGVNMMKAHEKLKIGKKEFDQTWVNLEKSLNDHKVPQELNTELKDIFYSVLSDIVTIK